MLKTETQWKNKKVRGCFSNPGLHHEHLRLRFHKFKFQKVKLQLIGSKMLISGDGMKPSTYSLIWLPHLYTSFTVDCVFNRLYHLLNQCNTCNLLIIVSLFIWRTECNNMNLHISTVSHPPPPMKTLLHFPVWPIRLQPPINSFDFVVGRHVSRSGSVHKTHKLDHRLTFMFCLTLHRPRSLLQPHCT